MKPRSSMSSDRKLALTVNNTEGNVLVLLSGSVNVDSSPDLRECLVTALSGRQAPRTVSIDLSRVSYIDTSGIATLIEGLRAARRRNTAFRLQGLGGPTLRLFEVTGVLGLFEDPVPTEKVS